MDVKVLSYKIRKKKNFENRYDSIGDLIREATGYERLLKESDHIKNSSKGTYVHNRARNVNSLEIFDPTMPSKLDQDWSSEENSDNEGVSAIELTSKRPAKCKI